jgi:membrane fusion protein (multidrug efflux system)
MADNQSALILERFTLLDQILKKSAILSFAILGLGISIWSRYEAPSGNLATENVTASDASLNISTKPFSAISEAQQFQAQTSFFRHAYDSEKAFPGEAVNALVGQAAISETSRTSRSQGGYLFIDMLPAVAKPLEIAELSTPSDGALVSLNVREGDQVQQGSLLAVTDDRIAAASCRVAEAGASREASLAVAKAKQTLAAQYLERIKQTFSEKAASGLELDEARSRLEEARAMLLEGYELKREAKAKLDLEQARLDDHRLMAPFSGTVTRIKKHVGETLTRDDVLMTLVNLSRLRAELNVPLQYIDHFPTSSTTRLIASLPNQPLLQATVVHVDPIIDAATNTFRIVVEIDNSDQLLPAGFAIRLIDPASSSVAASPVER